MASKKIVLTAQEKEISRLIESGAAHPASREKKARYLAVLGRKVEALRHGGARPGAGRKATGKKSPRKGVFLNMLPKTLKALEHEAGGRRGMGAVVDRLVEKAHLLSS